MKLYYTFDVSFWWLTIVLEIRHPQGTCMSACLVKCLNPLYVFIYLLRNYCYVMGIRRRTSHHRAVNYLSNILKIVKIPKAKPLNIFIENLHLLCQQNVTQIYTQNLPCVIPRLNNQTPSNKVGVTHILRIKKRLLLICCSVERYGIGFMQDFYT